MRLRESSAVLAATALVAGLLTGCTGSEGVGAAECLPPRLQVAPDVAAPGDTITVSSGPAECDLGYRSGHVYTLALAVPRLASPETTVRVATDGRFSATVTVPDTFPPGDAAIIVHGSPYDHCDGSRGSCAGYTAAITIADVQGARGPRMLTIA